MICLPSKGSILDPGHPPSLIKVFPVYTKKHWVIHRAHSKDSDCWFHFVGFVVLHLILFTAFKLGPRIEFGTVHFNCFFPVKGMFKRSRIHYIIDFWAEELEESRPKGSNYCKLKLWAPQVPQYLSVKIRKIFRSILIFTDWNWPHKFSEKWWHKNFLLYSMLKIPLCMIQYTHMMLFAGHVPCGCYGTSGRWSYTHISKVTEQV